jgi:hypothetical protein
MSRAPFNSVSIFNCRLMKIVRQKLGDETVRKLETLAGIWTDTSFSESSKAARRASRTSKNGNYFGVDQIKMSRDSSKQRPVSGIWDLDFRGKVSCILRISFCHNNLITYCLYC